MSCVPGTNIYPFIRFTNICQVHGIYDLKDATRKKTVNVHGFQSIAKQFKNKTLNAGANRRDWRKHVIITSHVICKQECQKHCQNEERCKNHKLGKRGAFPNMHEKQGNKCRFDNGNSQGDGSAHHSQILTGREPSHYRQDAQGKEIGPIGPSLGRGMQRHQRFSRICLAF